MVRVLIGMSGSGKTYRIQEEILHMHMDFAVTGARGICVIERKDYNEYSHVFHPDFVSVYKPNDSLVDLLLDAKNTEIFIDCENYSLELMDKVSCIVRKAKRNNNNVTITFLTIGDNSDYENYILKNADEILVGKCGGATEAYIENLFTVKLAPIINKFDFRKLW